MDEKQISYMYRQLKMKSKRHIVHNVTPVGKVGPSCLLGVSWILFLEYIINSLLTKLVQPRWLNIGLVLFSVFIDLDEELDQYIAILTSHLIYFKHIRCWKQIFVFSPLLWSKLTIWSEMYCGVFNFNKVNVHQFLQVRSTGALIKYVDKKRIGIELEDPDVRVPILGLKVFSL